MISCEMSRDVGGQKRPHKDEEKRRGPYLIVVDSCSHPMWPETRVDICRFEHKPEQFLPVNLVINKTYFNP